MVVIISQWPGLQMFWGYLSIHETTAYSEAACQVANLVASWLDELRASSICIISTIQRI